MNTVEFKQAMAALPLLTGATPAHSWPKHQQSLRNHAANDDPAEFLKWSTVTATMFVGSGAHFTELEYETLPGRYRAIIQEPGFGKPDTLKYNGVVTSGNLIHQAYHLSRLEERTGIEVNNLRWIVEFGGGYGAMAMLCQRLGFEGIYVIIDLPEMSLLQEYYLSNTLPLADFGRVEFVNNFNSNGWRIFTDLFIGVYSFSEISPEQRANLLRAVISHNYFIAYQEIFTLPDGQQVDNVAYFGMSERKWQVWENKVMPGHYYAIG